MSDKMPTTRLDQILLREGLVTEEQIKDALSKQKERGGRIGSQLLFDGYIDEAGLVKALATQCGCDGVVLSEIEIPEVIVRFIPTRVAVSRKVMPFDYDPNENVLKVACENPLDERLEHELSFVARGKKIQLYVAVELALINTIAKHYMDFDPSQVDGPLLQLPPVDDSLFETDAPTKKPDNAQSQPRSRLLLITEHGAVAEQLRAFLASEPYEIDVVTSIPEAVKNAGSRPYAHIFIHCRVIEQCRELHNRLRKLAPATRVSVFDSPSDLLLSNENMTIAADLAQRNLDLLALVAMSAEAEPDNTSLLVGQLADAVCRRLDVLPRERLFITTAAYLLNLGGRYYDAKDSSSDRKSVMTLAVRLLSALGYPTEVCDILNAAYTELPPEHRDAMPLSLLGGNILTVVDRYVSIQQVETGSAVDRLEAIQQEFTELEGIRYLPEVTQAFTEVMHDSRLDESGNISRSQVLLFGPLAEQVTPLAERMRADGFRTVAVYDADSFVELYHRSLPDIIVILSPDERQGTLDLLDGLTARNVDMTRTPSVLVTSGPLLREPATILDRGLSDVLPIDDPLNLLGVRLRRFRESRQVSVPQREASKPLPAKTE